MNKSQAKRLAIQGATIRNTAGAWRPCPILSEHGAEYHTVVGCSIKCTAGRIYALPDAMRVPCDHCHGSGNAPYGTELGHCHAPAIPCLSCKRLGWTPSEDLVVVARAAWPVMKKLLETETEGLRWVENWKLFDTYKTACAKGDMDGVWSALVQVLEAEGWNMGEVPEGVSNG